MKNDFNYKNFIQYVHKQFSDFFSEEDIENLFELSESYEKDDPKSQGKILSINELVFSGIKSRGIFLSKEVSKGNKYVDCR